MKLGDYVRIIPLTKKPLITINLDAILRSTGFAMFLSFSTFLLVLVLARLGMTYLDHTEWFTKFMNYLSYQP